MEVETASGSSHSPTPFLLKTYEMVDDSSTDHIVSWSSKNTSFIVWDPPEFSRLLLPTYFKHSNFSSFIRQLNTYGFRKIDPERWEFGNEDFLKDQKYLLNNIRRRKPIHSHSNPSIVDPERVAFEQEVERLSAEKKELEWKLERSKQMYSGVKLQFEDLIQRVANLEDRQDQVISNLESSVKYPTVLDYLRKKMESINFPQRRRFLQLDPRNELSLELSPSTSSSRIQLDSRKTDMISIQESSAGNGDGDDHASFHLNLTLASSMLQTNSHNSSKEIEVPERKSRESSTTSSSLNEGRNQQVDWPKDMVNDMFWEQFLTERPGSNDNEDSTSDSFEDQRLGNGTFRNMKNIENLTL